MHKSVSHNSLCTMCIIYNYTCVYMVVQSFAETLDGIQLFTQNYINYNTSQPRPITQLPSILPYFSTLYNILYYRDYNIIIIIIITTLLLLYYYIGTYT